MSHRQVEDFVFYLIPHQAFHSFVDLGLSCVCVFSFSLKNQFILLFNLFLLLFMGFIVHFDTIYESHCIISVNFYFYLQYFQ